MLQQAPKKTIRFYKRESFVFNTFNGLFMVILFVIMIYPFWNTIAVSFNNAQDTLKGGITFWPRKFSLYSYESVFRSNLMVTAAVNSVARTMIVTVLGVFISALIAYVISRKELIGRRFITGYFLLTMYISAGLIPTYFLIKDLGLLKNFWVYILPNLINVFNVIVIKSFILSLPDSLSEAAVVDGAGHFRCFIQIIVPCCKPVLATVALWYAVGAWNSWFDTFLYASAADNLTTLQYEMMKLLSSAMNTGRSGNVVAGQTQMVNTVTPASMRAAVTIVAATPILIVYPFLQKYFVKGVTLGAVKG
ncbi:MAG: carbohydrate ABC transporter permease [Oscillospiraceae bacterium]|jgi:putative aldouronate transport system permease protein|nr:carbohydrate ABC transporter permease [Oscillospiraceae bacterium]